MLILRKVRGTGVYIPPATIQNATYDNVSKLVNPQAPAVSGLAFSADGMKMYVADSITDAIYQYTMSTPWLISSASYDGISKSTAAVSDNIHGIYFNSDGTKAFINGTTNDNVYELTLSTPWNIGTAVLTYTFDMSSQASSGRGLAFSSQGDKMYIADTTTKAVYQYTLSIAWDLSTASYDNISFSVAGQLLDLQGVDLDASGTRMFILDGNPDIVYQYTLSIAWDLSTASYDNISFSIADQETKPTGLRIGNSNTKMYVCGTSSDSVLQYSL